MKYQHLRGHCYKCVAIMAALWNENCVRLPWRGEGNQVTQSGLCLKSQSSICKGGYEATGTVFCFLHSHMQL